MQFPKLTPLQSRFAATLAATILLVILYYVLFTDLGSFAYALEIRPVDPKVADYPLLIEGRKAAHDDDGDDGTIPGKIAARDTPAPQALVNNQFKQSNINLGETQYWTFPKSAVTAPRSATPTGLPANVTATDPSSASGVVMNHELKKRENTVYISLNTCLGPSLNSTNVDPLSAAIPPLTVYISTSENNKAPGPGKSSDEQAEYIAEQGYMGASFSAESDVYVSVAAPNSTLFSGVYNYDLAASIDAYFHSVDDDTTNLYFVDSDTTSALLITDNVTQSSPDSPNYQQWMNITPPYTMFAHNINNSAIFGLERSYCALSLSAQIRPGNNAINTSMTSRGLGNKPKEQFKITYLNSSSTYYGILGMYGNSTASGIDVIGGGGKVWRAMNFTTKADSNCALLYNLDFCSQVAYAVPSNPSIDLTTLAHMYDSNAQSYYQNFTNSLSLIPCNTSSISMYSLAVGCPDCASAYKQWLCAVTIPRCYDYSSNFSFLQPRNAGQAFLNGTTLPADDPLVLSPVTNASRNPLIDSQIKPGPYKEILPCHDLCNDLVRTCPSALGFQCPTGQYLNDSYGYRASNGDITCSYLGAAYYLNSSPMKLAANFSFEIFLGFCVLWLASSLFY
ncbi:calcium channel subunit Mid1 [Talaromyces proteolyticus]|uniref:Calcium channel subunit Mid1 n=1 Tax=Talaromyces proteolyticus TaxID=1131652 RepID=A0AAD4KWT3_9EURO|nr:calcium channel subunit Mid1 [Talaromyces proteolyticus]KAH8702612.1 calcium channel subunit Mid1 [Talaromyces proteolyticus]